MKRKGFKVLSMALAFALVFTTLLQNAFLGSVAFADDSSSEESRLVEWIDRVGGIKGSSSSDQLSEFYAAVIPVSSGGYVAAGRSYMEEAESDGKSKGNADALMVRYDEGGERLWETLVGGSKLDDFNSVIENQEGNFIAVGKTQSSTDDFEGMDKGGMDASVVVVTSGGAIQQALTIGGGDKDNFYGVAQTPDGGYAAVGYSMSDDGDFSGMNKGGKDAVIVKLDADLNIEWKDNVGGSDGGSSFADEFYSVVVTDDGIVAAGMSASQDGDFIHKGAIDKKTSQDAILVKYDFNGNRVFMKNFGGTDNDYFYDVKESANRGFVAVGYSASKNGDLAGVYLEGEESSVNCIIVKFDKDGELEWSNVLKNSGDNDQFSGVEVLEDGYVATGFFTKADGDLASLNSDDTNRDFLIARFDLDGDLLSTISAVGDKEDRATSLVVTEEGDYIVAGWTNSSASGDFAGAAEKGGSDAVLLKINAPKSTEPGGDQKETSLVPVEAWHREEDRKSMMAAMLYKDAFVESDGVNTYATVYFINAVIMNTHISPSILGKVSYFDKEKGDFVQAAFDEYDPLKQVKTVKVKVSDLSETLELHIENAMGDIRLKFDPQGAVESANPPVFEDIIVDAEKFPAQWITAVGGTSADYISAAAQLKNGDYIIGGQSYSNDFDFNEKLKGGSMGTLIRVDKNGEILTVDTLGGANPDSITYVGTIMATDDGGFVAVGGYQEDKGDASGDFAEFKGKYKGLIDGYIAKYSKTGEREWIKLYGGAQNDQFRHVVASPSGGYTVIVASNSNDGDFEGMQKAIYYLIVMELDENGNLIWKRSIGGGMSSILTTNYGLIPAAGGGYIAAGHTASGAGDFAGVPHKGGMFDIFLTKISSNGEVEFSKKYGGAANDYFSEIIASPDGGYALVGSTQSRDQDFSGFEGSAQNAYILKLDSDFNVQWKHILVGSEISSLSSVVATSYGYIAAGSSSGNDGIYKETARGAEDILLVRYSKDGTLMSLNNIGGSAYDTTEDLIATKDGGFALAGFSKSNDGDFEGLNKSGFDGVFVKLKPESDPILEEEVTVSPVDNTAEITKDELEQLTAAGSILANFDNGSVKLPSSVLAPYKEALLNGSSLALTKKNSTAEIVKKASQKLGTSSTLLKSLSVDLRLIREEQSTPIKTLSGKAKVVMKLTAEEVTKLTAASDKKIYYYDPAQNTLTDMKAEFNLTQQTAAFETDHFSDFVLAYTVSSGGTGGGSGSSGGSGGSGGGSSSSGGGSTAVTKPETEKNTPVSSGTKFADISNHWAKKYIELAVEKSLFSGTTETAFSPNASMSRGMFVTVLGRAYGIDPEKYDLSSFQDVSKSAYYSKYITWASENGLVQGVGNNSFNPNASISREEMAVMLAGYAKFAKTDLKTGNAEGLNFKDADSISGWAKESVLTMYNAGILTGNENQFLPKGQATRAEAATVLVKMFGYAE